jgi:1,3-beta-glucanosyltransferase GAS1
MLQGSQFFYATNGSQFFIRGVLYRDSGQSAADPQVQIDVLSDGPRCERDIPYLTKLGINTIHVSGEDSRLNHDQCMKLLEKAGIYVLVTINGPESIPQRIVNGTRWVNFDVDFEESIFKVIDLFQSYRNTLGFYISIHDHEPAGLLMVPTWKAVVRDVKDYTQTKHHKSIPIGAGIREYTPSTLAQYLNCDEEKTSVDFLIFDLTTGKGRTCINLQSLLETELIDGYRDSSIPLFFFYGCVVEMEAIYSDAAAGVFSGGIILEWSANRGTGVDSGKCFRVCSDFDSRSHQMSGIVEVKGDNVELLPRYSALSTQFAMFKPTPTQMSQYTATKVLEACHNFTSWEAQDPITNLTQRIRVGVPIPPKPNRQLCSCMVESSGCIADKDGDLLSISLNRSAICDKNEIWCKAWGGRVSTGEYGSFYPCSFIDKASWTLNQYYLSQGNDTAACQSFGGVPRKPVEEISQSNECQVLLKQAGPDGTGTITYIPSATTRLDKQISRTSDGLPGGLPRGAKIGIAVGSVAISILLLLATLVIFGRLRKRKNIANENPGYDKPELDGNLAKTGTERPGVIQIDSGEIRELEGSLPLEMHANDKSIEIDGSPRVEMSTGDERHELSSTRSPRVEMSTGDERHELSSTRSPQSDKTRYIFKK